MTPHSVQPDFNLRLRSAIRRAEEVAAQPVTWQSRLASVLLRPALAGASVVVLGLAGLGAWSMMKAGDAPSAAHHDITPAVSPEFGLDVRSARPSVRPGELIPVDGSSEEALRLQARYLEAGQLPRDYVMEGIPVEAASYDSSMPRYVLPTVSPDQVTGKVSY